MILDRASLGDAVAVLTAAGVPSPDVDARLLWEFASDREQFDALVARRASRVPLQHLTRRAWFRHLELIVGAGVFIPRPETELLAQCAIDELRAMGGRLAVDLCAGSGAVAVSIATEVPGVAVHAVEVSDAALEYLRHNAVLAGGSVLVHHGDATDPAVLGDIDGMVDVVTANPPYIPAGMVPREPEVRDHDPGLALYGGLDGLDIARGVVARAATLLRPGGLFAMEHADVQGESVIGLFGPGWAEVRDHEDYNGLPRYVTARRIGS